MSLTNRKPFKLLIILICLLNILVYPFASNAFLKNPNRYELSKREIRKIFNSYSKEHTNITDGTFLWNPNEVLENTILLWSPLRAIAKYTKIDNIIPLKDPKFYIAKYDSIDGNTYTQFLGFSSFEITDIPIESLCFICINESYKYRELELCVDNDTIISIRTLMDLFPTQLDEYNERVMFISSCDNVIETEEGFYKDTNPTGIMFTQTSIELYEAIKKWDIAQISSILTYTKPMQGRNNILFFSRAIFNDRNMVEYSAFFCLFPFSYFDKKTGETIGIG